MIATPKTPGQGRPMVMTVAPDFRMTQMDTTGPNGERMVTRARYTKVNGKWVTTATATGC